MKKLNEILAAGAILFVVTQTRAGTLTVNDSLTVATNLTAQSITLSSATQANWIPLQGYKYVVVAEGTTTMTNLGVLVTDIWSNTWTGPIGEEPVIAWGWAGH